MAEAAEKRKRDDEGRGVKDPEALKRKQQRREDIEKKAEQSGGGGEGGGLRVRVAYQFKEFLYYIVHYTVIVYAFIFNIKCDNIEQDY